jgi:hypothetical protein
MRGGEYNCTVLSALTSRAPRCSVSSRRHDTIQVKSPTEIKPEDGLQGATAWEAVHSNMVLGNRHSLLGPARDHASRKFFVFFAPFVVNCPQLCRKNAKLWMSARK